MFCFQTDGPITGDVITSILRYVFLVLLKMLFKYDIFCLRHYSQNSRLCLELD